MSDDFSLFDDIKEKGTEEWTGMPDHIAKDEVIFQSIKVYFRNEKDRDDFAKLTGQKITKLTPTMWYPPKKNRVLKHLRWKSRDNLQPKYPVYIISKGRWESRLTSRALETIGTPYHIVIEPQEYTEYAEVIDPSKILVLPFSNLGQGSIPARNWVWEHAISTGAERHWILDDNIRRFCRIYDSKEISVADGTCFKLVEDFVDRYENIPISGMNYTMFVPQNQKVPPYYLNTRVYSCILIQNNLTINGEPVRWRGRYNEDTDLSLRVLKAGYCTYLSNPFCCQKMPTMTMKGGNTEDLYKIKDGRLKMAQSLVEQHPDVTTITEKWGRFQHQVNYEPFKRNKLILKPGVIIPEGDPYGIELVDITETMENPDIPDEEFDNQGYTIDPDAREFVDDLGYTIDPDTEEEG